jgi:hypothetical protein
MSLAKLALIASLIGFTLSISVEFIPRTGTPPSSREQAGLTIHALRRKLYLYGGKSDYRFDDMWEFDLNSNIWSEIHPASVLKPGPRSSPFITSLKDEDKIVLFGGDTSAGPISDVWLYDIENQSVIVILVENHRRERKSTT